MKRSICLLTAIIICLISLLPVTVYAETFRLSGTDMSIEVDTSSWYVFTRDNIQNNPELDELGISYDTMYNILYDNSAYMDAVLYYEDGDYVEFFVRNTTVDSGIANLSNYANKEVLEFARGLAEKQIAPNYTVYENEYKFARLEYVDSKLGFYICEFCTIVNKEVYTLTFQSASEFTDSEHEEIQNIVDSIQFDIDTTLKEAKTASPWSNVITNAIGGAVAGGIAGGLIAIINKKKAKSKASKEAASADNPAEN